ncbi:MAG: hypothetical protein H7067_09425, partial [Burkholderiales bacterium]|nr:hypothetical protein [Opitutaceae bacterium]
MKLAEHRGGFTPFWVDLPEAYAGGSYFTVVLRARDYHRESKPRGKQSERHDNYGCLYTRTTGIWQTVWLEPLGAVRVGRPRITPQVEAGGFGSRELALALFSGRPIGGRGTDQKEFAGC